MHTTESYAWRWAGSVRVKGRSAHFEWHSLTGKHNARVEDTERTHTNTWKARNKEPSQPHAHTQKHMETRAQTQLNHFWNFYRRKLALSFFKEESSNNARGRRTVRQTHDADGRLWASVCAVISSVTTLADFPGLNYHLTPTSGAPQDHRQTAISTCPQRGRKMEETHLDKKAPHKQDSEGKEEFLPKVLYL